MKRELLEDSVIEDRLRGLAGWERAGKGISRIFTFEDFRSAFGFMTKVAEKAEELDHHPDWSNSWNRVEVKLTTHSAGGLTDLDFGLAAFMDEAAGG